MYVALENAHKKLKVYWNFLIKMLLDDSKFGLHSPLQSLYSLHMVGDTKDVVQFSSFLLTFLSLHFKGLVRRGVTLNLRWLVKSVLSVWIQGAEL